MKRSYFLVLDFIILFLLLCFAFYRDVRLIRQFPADLRNRVVGARLINDGKLPYFYKWKKGDDTRYLDYNNSSGVKISNMTGSPFMHQLMIPLSILSQKTISIIWLALEYFCLIIIIICAILLCALNLQKLIVLHVGLCFLFTEAWIYHIYVGQLYLLIAGMTALACLLLIKYTSTALQALAALLTLSIILVRPIFIVFLIPFIFYFAARRIYLVSFFVFCILYGLFLFSSSWQRSLWLDYKTGITEHIKMHQGQAMQFGKDESLPRFNYFEGYHMDDVARLEKNSPYKKQSENGNFFILYKLITGKPISLFWLNAACLVLIMLLYWRYDLLVQHSGFDTRRAVMLGITLYLVMEIFLPIHRHQYNTVQFFPLILIFLSTVTDYKSVAFILCITGVCLNITNTQLIPLRHTLGEAFIIFAILLTVFKRNKEYSNGTKGDNHRSWTSRINSSI